MCNDLRLSAIDFRAFGNVASGISGAFRTHLFKPFAENRENADSMQISYIMLSLFSNCSISRLSYLQFIIVPSGLHIFEDSRTAEQAFPPSSVDYPAILKDLIHLALETPSLMMQNGPQNLFQLSAQAPFDNTFAANVFERSHRAFSRVVARELLWNGKPRSNTYCVWRSRGFLGGFDFNEENKRLKNWTCKLLLLQPIITTHLQKKHRVDAFKGNYLLGSLTYLLGVEQISATILATMCQSRAL
ncbi:uncharacterized protein BDR25DRAFT_354659 [Lindgomyces ingoldianus]|uniref:Uncharacterized protein n=1 Tax=Lindgomyces ingoldianus TaxID=673940 RepID=A0ACB6QX90_9PLEO|nr:uncharacterized protein BDR25DRAFT_354659 [Lindgomyces ingoldianus]KAF2471422.1 hypothetical protein BDR25DRAFT_354659 [Lindgomyces ingoldianus]